LQRIVFRFLVALSIALGLLSCSGDTSTGRNSGAVLQKDGTEDQNVGGTSASSSSATTAPASSAAAPAAGAASSYEAYVNSYLDLNLAYNQYAAAGGKMTKDQWGRQHYTVAGQKEGRIVPAASPTATTTAPTTVSYTAYVDSYPDLKAAYRTYVSNGGILSQSDWGKQHYTNAGQKEGRRLTGSVATSVASSSGGSGGSVVAAPVTTSPFNASAVGCPDRSVGGAYPYCECQAGFVYNNPYNTCLTDHNYCPAGTARVWDDKYDYVVQCFSYERMCSEYGDFCDRAAGGGSSSSSSSGSSSSSEESSSSSSEESSSSSSEESSSSSSSSSSSVTYCTDASVNWPSMVSVGSTINVSWSLSPSGCTVRNNSSVAPSASNFAGSSSGSSASVSSGSTSLPLPCSGGIDTTPHIGNSKNRMNFDFSSLGAALGNGNSYSGYAQMTGGC